MILKGITSTRLQTWDSMRSLDYLASHPLVDPRRLASTGQSGGGTTTMLLAAVDDRLAAAAPCCGNTENVACGELHPTGLDRRRRAGSHRVRPDGFRSLGPTLSAGPEASARAGQRPRLLRDVLAELHHQRHRGVPQASRRLSDIGPRRAPRVVRIATAPRAFLRDATPDLFLVRAG